MTIISSYHKSEIQFFRNHIPFPRILKLIRRNKLSNPPDDGDGSKGSGGGMGEIMNSYTISDKNK